LEGLLTEIRTFYSLKEIRENIDSGMGQYKLLLDDYSQWLGTLLRNPETSRDKERAKKTAELQKIFRAGVRKGRNKEEKKVSVSTEWIQFKDIMLSADELGEAEMLFDAIEELRGKIEKLERAKNSIIDLERYGLGKELLYITYIRDGVPEKLVFIPKNNVNITEKFKFMTEFSTVQQALQSNETRVEE